MIAFVAGFSLLAWAYLAFFHRGFWRADQRLPEGDPAPDWPAVTAIVPARNEAPTIAAVVEALKTQDYAGRFHILVVDDSSTDGTAQLAGAAAQGFASFDLITAPPLAAGWTGKLAALDAGLRHEAAQAAKFIWFTDADVVHAPTTLARLAGKARGKRAPSLEAGLPPARHDKRDLVSLMVRLRCESFWERLLIPAFIFFFQMLYPFPAVNDPRSRTAAAAGGCVLVSRERLAAAGGLQAIRGEIIDDCALGRIIKRAGGRLWLGLADDSRSLRAADSVGPLWSMVQRTAFTQLHHSILLLVLTLAGLALVFLGPAFVVLTLPWHGNWIATLAGLAAMGLTVRCYAPTLRDYGRSPWEGLRLPLAAALYGAMTAASALAHLRRRGGGWKGRYYGPSSEPLNLSKSP